MGTVTPVVVPGEGYVRVEVDWRDFPHARKCWIYRRVNGVATRLRDGNAVRLSGGIAVAYDHEAPLDTPVLYRSSIGLNWNGDFEDGVTEWTDATNSGTVGTVTQSRDYYVVGEGLASAKLTPSGAATSKAVSEIIPITPSTRNANPFFETGVTNWTPQNGATRVQDGTAHEGGFSMLITPDGVSTFTQVVSEEIPVVPGRSYAWSGWLRVSAGGSLARTFGIRWLDAAHAQIVPDSVTTLTPTPAVWTQFGPGSAVAPAGAVTAQLITQGPNAVLVAANTWRLDEAIFYDVTQARTYTIQGRLMVPNYWSGGVGVKIQWYYGTTLLGTTGAFNDFAPFPGDWGSYGFSATDMITANGMRAVFGLDGSAPTTLPLYGDEIYLTQTGLTTVDAATTSIVPSQGGGWWTDPLHPATKVRLQVDLDARECKGPFGVVYLGVGEETFPADASLAEVNDAVNPIATWNRRKSGRSSIRLGILSDADLSAVKALHSSGAPLFLQINSAYREADAYGLHGDVATPRVHGDQRVPWFVVGSSFGKTGPPVGPAEGTLKTRYMDLNRYPTFAAATAAGVTWLDALQGKLAL